MKYAKKNLIILNDMRSTPVLASIKLKNSIDDSILIAHESIFKNKEYADYTPRSWKSILKFILKITTSLRIIKSISKDYSNEDGDLGVQSSLFSITEDSNASKDKYPDIYFQIKNLALGAKDIIFYIKKNNFRNIFLFNGRTASSYLITKYCTENNINIFFIEYAGHANGFRLFPVPPHASKKIGELLLAYYRYGVYSPKSLRDANEFLIKEKLNSVYARENKIPTNLKYDICIFLGSDFEYTATNKNICGVEWLGNIKFCELVFKKYGLKKSYVIRFHPNSAKDSNSFKLEEELRVFVKNIGVNAELISANEKIDSHMLIQNSSLIVTDLSTISLDAIILNKPVDIFGNTDIRYIYNNQWIKDLKDKKDSRIFSEPFSLVHNLLVFRFNMQEKFFWKLLFYINRCFEKLSIWKKNKYKFQINN